MARLETNTNLVGKTIVLLNGTKTKIEDAIASGYKVKGQSKRIATRCVVKEGAHFREIERMNLALLEDTGEGYVKIKAAPKAGAGKTNKKETAAPAPKAGKKKPAVEEKAPKAGKKKPAPVVEEKAPKVRRKKTEAQDVAKSVIKSNVPAVEIAETDAPLTEAVAKRIFAALQNQPELARLCADNKTPIANDLDITYACEYASEARIMQITLNLQYAAPLVTETASAPELDAAVAKRAAKLAAKKIGAKLAKAIKVAFDLEDANDLLPGTVLNNEGTEYVFVGESAKHPGKALMYLADTDGFKSFAADKLAEFELVEDEAADEEPEDEDEIEDEIEDEDDEPSDDEPSDDEFEFVSVDSDQLALVNKKVTAKYHAKLADLFGTDVETLAPGLVLTNGETTFAYLGCDNKGGLLVIDLSDDADEDDNVLVYSKAQIEDLTDFAPSLGDAASDADDADDADDEDFEDDADATDTEDGDDDFEFDDEDAVDLDDLSEDELRDRAVELGLTTERKAGRMDEEALRALF